MPNPLISDGGRRSSGSDLGLTAPALLVVSDGRGDPTRIRALGQAAASGGAWGFYLREPALAASTLGELARELRGLGLRVLVGDRVDVALASGAFGAQLGERALPVERVRAWVGDALHLGRSVHDLAGAQAAARGGAEWVLFGQVFASPSKPGRAPAGIARMQAVAARSPVPVLAIGGIQAARVAEVMAGGAGGVAVISAVASAPDPARAVAELMAALAAAGSGARAARAEGG